MSQEETEFIEAATRFANAIVKKHQAGQPLAGPATSVFHIQITTPPPEKLAYNKKEAAEAIGVSERTIDNLIKRKLLKRNGALRHVIVPRAEVERFLRDSI